MMEIVAAVASSITDRISVLQTSLMSLSPQSFTALLMSWAAASSVVEIVVMSSTQADEKSAQLETA